jgi:hypothetical protein
LASSDGIDVSFFFGHITVFGFSNKKKVQLLTKDKLVFWNFNEEQKAK